MYVRDVSVPDAIRVLRERQTLELFGSGGIEETHLNLGGVGGKEREVRPLAIPDCPREFANVLSFTRLLLLLLILNVDPGCCGRLPRRWR